MAHFEEDDEEAFRWAGDEDTGREGARLPGARGEGTELPDDAPAAADGQPHAGASRRPGVAAVTILFALLYLALTVGWILGTGYTSAGTTGLLPQVLWQFGEFTAIIAAPMWFATTVLLTPSRLGVRAGALALGLGVLLPWPVLPLLVVGA